MSTVAISEELPDPVGSINIASHDPWSGLYVGVNLGYSVGTSGSAQGYSTPVSDNWANWASYNSRSPNGCNNQPCTSYTDPIYGAAAIASSGKAIMTQYGIVGGAQVGINRRVFDFFVAGLELDFQGSDISGNGDYTNSFGDKYSNGKDSWSSSRSRMFIGNGRIKTAINWLGSLRPRGGILLNEKFLLYATGGLTFGNASINAHNSLFLRDITSINYLFGGAVADNIYTAASTAGNSRALMGWSAGGGFEFLLTPSWSVKTEAIYYNLGSLNVTSQPLTVSSNEGITSSNIVTSHSPYQGIVARAGLNYHFDW